MEQLTREEMRRIAKFEAARNKLREFRKWARHSRFLIEAMDALEDSRAPSMASVEDISAGIHLLTMVQLDLMRLIAEGGEK